MQQRQASRVTQGGRSCSSYVTEWNDGRTAWGRAFRMEPLSPS